MKTNKSLNIIILLVILMLSLISVKVFAGAELGIEAVLNSSLENNKKLLAAEQKLEAAAGKNSASKSIMNSNLKGELSWQEEELIDDGNLFTSLKYSKFLAESEGIKAQLNQSELEYLIAELEYSQLRDQILADIIKQYYNLLKIDKSVSKQKAVVKEAESLYDNAQQRYDDSLITKADLIRTEINLDQSKQALKSLKNSRKTAADHFQRLTGIDQDNLQLKEENLIKSDADLILTEEKLLKLAFHNRSDYQIQLLNSELINSRINYIKSEEKPVFSLGGEYNSDDGKISSSLNSKYLFNLEGRFDTLDQDEIGGSSQNIQQIEESEWKVTAALSYEFSDGGRKEAEIGTAEANLNESEIKIEDLKSEIKIEISGKLRQLEEAEAKIKTAEKNLKKAELEYESTKNRYQKGAVIESDVFSAQKLLKIAETEVIEAKYEYQLQKAEILLEVQSLYHSLNSGELGGDK